MSPQFEPEAEPKRGPNPQNGESFPVVISKSIARGRNSTAPQADLTTLVGMDASRGCRVLFAKFGLVESDELEEANRPNYICCSDPASRARSTNPSQFTMCFHDTFSLYGQVPLILRITSEEPMSNV